MAANDVKFPLYSLFSDTEIYIYVSNINSSHIISLFTHLQQPNKCEILANLYYDFSATIVSDYDIYWTNVSSAVLEDPTQKKQELPSAPLSPPDSSLTTANTTGLPGVWFTVNNSTTNVTSGCLDTDLVPLQYSQYPSVAIMCTGPGMLI